MAEKAKTREVAEKKYNSLLQKRDGIQEEVREAKHDLDEFIIRENLAARLGVDAQDLEGEELNTLQRIAAKSRATANEGRATVDTIVVPGGDE